MPARQLLWAKGTDDTALCYLSNYLMASVSVFCGVKLLRYTSFSLSKIFPRFWRIFYQSHDLVSLIEFFHRNYIKYKYRKNPEESCDKTNCDILDIQKNMPYAVFNENWDLWFWDPTQEVFLSTVWAFLHKGFETDDLLKFPRFNSFIHFTVTFKSFFRVFFQTYYYLR